MNIGSWPYFDVNGLAVPRELMGQRQTFAFESASIEVALPSCETANESSNRNIASRKSWRVGSENNPDAYYVHRVRLFVDRGFQIELDPEILKRRPNATESIAEEQQKTLEVEAQFHRALAVRAFSYWLSVVRWTTDNHMIGQLGGERHEAVFGQYLVERDSKHDVWSGTQHLDIRMTSEVTPEQWQTVGNRLSALEVPPLHVGFHHDALSLMDEGDYRRCLVDLAICCETYLRTQVLDSLPELPKNVWKHIEEGNINQYISKLFPELLGARGKDVSAYKPLKEELQSLMSRRNDILHRGDSNGATVENCQRFAAVVGRLLAL